MGFVKQWGSGFKNLVIQCARIGGVEISNKKRTETSLQYVHGVGQTTVQKILLNVGLVNKITSEVSEPEPAKIHKELVGYMIEGEVVCC
jgi:small subunit ribosomal protein S13